MMACDLDSASRPVRHSPITCHHRLPLRCNGFRKEIRTDNVLSNAAVLERNDCQGAECTVRMRRLLFAGCIARTGQEQLPRTTKFWGITWSREISVQDDHRSMGGTA